MTNALRLPIMPEFLSKSELLYLLREKFPNYAGNFEERNREELIYVAWQLPCFPKPQRIPRDNRRGLILQAEREEAASSAYSSEETGPNGQRNQSTTSDNERLKPALCQREEFNARKIQLKKPEVNPIASQSNNIAHGNVIKSRPVTSNGVTAHSAGDKRHGQSDEKEVPEAKRARHTKIKYP